MVYELFINKKNIVLYKIMKIDKVFFKFLWKKLCLRLIKIMFCMKNKNEGLFYFKIEEVFN